MRDVLRLRDQKQVDLEDLSGRLSKLVIERDRLSSLTRGRPGTAPQGITAYFRDKVDALRGADDDQARYDKMRKLDVKIKTVRICRTTVYRVMRDGLFVITDARRSLRRSGNVGCIQ